MLVDVLTVVKFRCEKGVYAALALCACARDACSNCYWLRTHCSFRGLEETAVHLTKPCL